MPHHKTKRAKEPKIYGPNTGTPTRKELHKMGPTKRKPLPPPAPHPNKRKPQPPTVYGGRWPGQVTQSN